MTFTQRQHNIHFQARAAATKTGHATRPARAHSTTALLTFSVSTAARASPVMTASRPVTVAMASAVETASVSRHVVVLCLKRTQQDMMCIFSNVV